MPPLTEIFKSAETCSKYMRQLVADNNYQEMADFFVALDKKYWPKMLEGIISAAKIQAMDELHK